jgi:hypothetical protein
MWTKIQLVKCEKTDLLAEVFFKLILCLQSISELLCRKSLLHINSHILHYVILSVYNEVCAVHR